MNFNDVDPEFWSGKTVFLTGHTGFKGGWLSLWLNEMGAIVHGFALPPETDPSLFDVIGVARLCERSTFGDIRDSQQLRSAMVDARPDVVIHMAAQALVKPGYDRPVETFDTNVMGTIHVMEAVRRLPADTICLVVTSDKCYDNPNDGVPLREQDPMGGHDPYSASKGACEVAVASWRHSFFSKDGTPSLASARAGNVIGGGDWSGERLLPDAARAFSAGQSLVIRNPLATRPWQHVLEPLSGYLVLIQRIARDRSLAKGWNFGPIPAVSTPVSEIAEIAARVWSPEAQTEISKQKQDWSEAHALLLDSTAALRFLGWRPRLDVAAAVEMTMQWYAYHDANGRDDMLNYSRAQLQTYRGAAYLV